MATPNHVKRGSTAASWRPREKRLLIRMAERLPRWVNSDHLTALGAVAMAGGGRVLRWRAFWQPALLLVVPLLAVNWFGDSLDGTLARVRNQERPRYGFYVDHVLDARRDSASSSAA